MKKELFEELYRKNLDEYLSNVKGGDGSELTYLSWAWAWAAIMKICPDATYEVVKFDGLPYVYDPKTGYMVYTRVTIEDTTHEMWLPVMNASNKAMKAEPYKYTTKYGEKTVEAATMFDINKTVMRCLVKNLAMFGLGLYIYAKEDLPELTDEEKETLKEMQKKISKKDADTLAKVLTEKQLAWVHDRYCVKELTELTNQQYGELMRTINDRENANGK